MISYVIATTEEEYAVAGTLFEEYAQTININLGFQQFDLELASLKQMYSTSHGGIILVKEAGDFIGCVGVRKINDTIGELKRMYIKPAHQKKGIGKVLLQQAINLAGECNYEKLQLDTLNYMQPAIRLYVQAGFYEIPPYYENPIATAVYFEILLTPNK